MSQQIDHFIDPQNPVQPGHGSVSAFTGVTDPKELYSHSDTQYESFDGERDYIDPDHPQVRTFDEGMDFVKGGKPGEKCMRARTFAQSGIVAQMTTYILGFNIKETTGTGTASVVVHQGTDAGQLPIAYFTLAANESARDYFTYPIESRGGVYIEIVSGSVAGILYTEDHKHV